MFFQENIKDLINTWKEIQKIFLFKNILNRSNHTIPIATKK